MSSSSPTRTPATDVPGPAHSPPPAKAGGPGALGRVGRACHRHRWLTLLTWILGVACLITLWTRFGAPAQDNFE